MLLSVIIPVFNEQDNIRPIYDRLLTVVQKLNTEYEFIFVNDGSSDKSQEELTDLSKKHPHVKFIQLSRNFGHQIAVSAGLDFCKGDKVVLIDADGQDPPEVIEKLYLKSLEGYDVVYAKRKRRMGESALKKFTAKWFYRLMNKITQIEIPVDTGDFRIMNKRVVEQLRRMPERHKFLRAQVAWVGFRQTFVEYERDARMSGDTGYSYRKMIRLALDGITSFSNFPLKLATISGFLFSIVGFFLIIYTLYSRMHSETYVQGWASQMITLIFIGGIQLIGIGIIGEYISRISDNVKKRPLYIIDKTNIN